MAATASAYPAGTVTSVMRTSAQKEGAFRLLESKRVKSEEITNAMASSAATACGENRLVFVAVDQTDLTFVDHRNVRGLGPDNARMSKTKRATQVMNALALDSRGVPIGLVDQQWWLRPEEKAPTWKQDKRPAQERESYSWVRTLDACDERIVQHGRDCRAWYVCDRGADLSALLATSLDKGRLFTIRAAQNRVVRDSRGRKRKLFTKLQRQSVVGTLSVSIPRGPNRRPRRARCEVRFVSDVEVRLGGKFHSLSAVSVREVGHVPDSRQRICWRLLTSASVVSFADAMTVIRSYTFRWRVEEFHRTWKSGGCNVERSQLRSYAALRRWATILAAVATRVERLKRLSRATPDVDALTEISQAEIDLAIAYTEDKRHKPGDTISLKQAVRLIAMVGGYMGRNSDGPPGSITLKRGLERLAPALKALENFKRNG